MTVRGSSAGWGKEWGREGVEGEQEIVLMRIVCIWAMSPALNCMT